VDSSEYIELDDARIFCRISGRNEAPPLVLLHGNGENLNVFESQIKFFSTDYKVIALDTRGHGKSSRGKAPLDFHTFAADLRQLFDALKINKAHLVGFSDGAIIALHFALKSPERISSMILVGANYTPKGFRFTTRIYVKIFYLYLSMKSIFSSESQKRREIWSLMVHHPHLSLDEISQISAPTLIITGENDMVSQVQNNDLHVNIANSKRLIIPKADHFFLFKTPEIFNRIAGEFFCKP
jgi:pimeloyl-ACP methyl ester carboxylesterase